MKIRRAFSFLGLLACTILACSVFDRLTQPVGGEESSVSLNEVLFAPGAGQSAFVEIKATTRSSLEGLTLSSESGETLNFPPEIDALSPDRFLLIVFDGENRVEGDVIHAVNGFPVSTPEALRSAVDRIEQRGAVVLQVERDGQLTYVAFERE